MFNVLIADDDRFVLKGLSTVIKWEEMGAQVVAAVRNGKEAIKVINSNNVDLLISDIKMPEMDGLALAKYISDNNLNIIMVLFSAYGEFEYAKKAMDYNVREYLLKPIDLEVLNKIKDLVKREIRKKQQRIDIKNKIHSEEFEKEIEDSVKENDSQSIKNILGIDVCDMDIGLIKDYYCIVVEHVFRYVKGAVYPISKEDVIEEIFRYNDSESVKSYASNTIRKMLELMNIDRNKNIDNLLEYIKNYIDDMYSDPEISVTWVANKFGLDLSYFSLAFKEKYNITPKKYIFSKKMEGACRLLRETDLKAYEIGNKVGYLDSQYFANIFKKEYGVTPIEYRKKYRSE